MKRLFYSIVVLLILVTTLVSCHGMIDTEIPTTTVDRAALEANTTTIQTTREVSSSSPFDYFAPPDREYKNNVEEFIDVNGVAWCGSSRTGLVGNIRADKEDPSIVHPWAFRMGYDHVNGVFDVDPSSNIHTLRLTTPYCVFIKTVDEVNYVQYEIEYYETPNFWEIWFVPKGFIPVEDESYQMVLVIKSNDSPANAYPDSLLYMDLFPEDVWTYEIPKVVPNPTNRFENAVPDFLQRTSLIYHDELSIDSEGNLRYTFKNDNQPFKNATLSNGDEIYGLSRTKFGKLFINGTEYQIVDHSYQTELGYIITFKICGFQPVSGEKYEVFFSIDPIDSNENYCKNEYGYFVLQDKTFP